MCVCVCVCLVCLPSSPALLCASAQISWPADWSAAFADPNRISIINEPRAAKRLTTRGPNPKENPSPAVNAVTCRVTDYLFKYSWQAQSNSLLLFEEARKKELIKMSGKFSQAFSLMITCSFLFVSFFFWPLHASSIGQVKGGQWQVRAENGMETVFMSWQTPRQLQLPLSLSPSLAGQAVCQGHNEQNFRYFRAIRRKTHQERGKGREGKDQGQLGVLCKWLLWSQMLMRQRLLCRQPEKGCSCQRGWIELANSE